MAISTLPVSLGKEIRDTLDVDTPLFRQRISSLQVEYFNKNGKYWQGVSVDKKFGKPVGRPTDQSDGWELFKEDIPQGGVSVDVYNGPMGMGYTVNFTKELNGKKYTKSDSFGPESGHRTFDWVEIVPIK